MQGSMTGARDSAKEDTIMEEPPTTGVTPKINKTSSVEDTSATQEATTAGMLTVLRRSTRVVPRMLSKVTKDSPKKVPTKASTQDKAVQLKKILRSKTPGPKFKKPSLTPEKIEEDMILMGIPSATNSKPKTLLQTDSKKSSQSLSGHMASTVNDNDQGLSGTSNVRVETKLPQPGMSPHSLKTRIDM
jgi:hypothetical protein